MILLGGLAVLTGLYVVVSFWMHNFWTINDSQQRMLEAVRSSSCTCGGRLLPERLVP